MGILSKRTTTRLAKAVASHLGASRVAEILTRISTGGLGEVPAEWELLTAYLFRTHGTLHPCEGGRTSPEFLFEGPDNLRTVVEVTAVSDKSQHEANPLEAFSEELTKRARHSRLAEHGGFSVDVGDTTDAGGVRLGLPARQEFAAFFSDTRFKTFLRSCQDAPDESHTFVFTCNGSSSLIAYSPTFKRYALRTAASFVGVHDAGKNFIQTALTNKARQIKKFDQTKPSVLVLCNNSSFAWNLSRSRRNEAPTVGDVLQRYFERGTTISAVLVLERDKHTLASSLVVNPNAKHPLSASAQALLTGVTRAAPRLQQGNSYTRKRPQLWRQFSVDVSEAGSCSLRLSLSTVLGVLSGRIDQQDFLAAHPEACHWLSDIEPGDVEITDIAIQAKDDDDDDFLCLVKAPTRKE